jgi:outer membrane protein OmpA-like peptidoglycan-associated protein
MRRLGLLGVLCLLSLPAQAAAPARSFVVFFQEWSAAIDPSAQSVIASAAAWAKAHPGDQVTVTGAADRTGSGKANRLLSDLRAQVVTDQLAADAVPEARVRQVGLGSIGYELKSQMSRRVIISVAAP